MDMEQETCKRQGGEGERTTAKQGHDTRPPEVKGLSIPAVEGTLEGEDLKKHLK